ncbi:hypothetical protein PF010_g12836 [Phytophthora fragariae]|uniref:Uncharacterized protein n=2 Tax=Phytophthora TaxID=4783 RepID=A0A6A3SQQ1_9STRA|nr:hypothetical protein PF009_g8101 [Phytophthora fragariae]KAE9037709.1 hypothetical protein PR002_g6405 [Phytophthora rubi]KAE9105863.1 hypothetical protein PF010_g12836 [Phytophthora fragariae]KAE9122144.1 hypothetical protein PF007_g7551 [Phytophthora fragariae]KAE9227363.1 hypothetical protein PF004_g11382 [Phytophthora fragariae]
MQMRAPGKGNKKRRHPGDEDSDNGDECGGREEDGSDR